MTRFISLFVVALVMSSCASNSSQVATYDVNDTLKVEEKVIGCKFSERHGAWTDQQVSLISGPLKRIKTANQEDYYCAIHRATKNSDGVFESLPDKVFKTWVDPNTGRIYSIMPIATRVAPDSPPCRIFQTTNHGRFTAIGMVCRDSYGRWRLIN